MTAVEESSVEWFYEFILTSVASRAELFGFWYVVEIMECRDGTV